MNVVRSSELKKLEEERAALVQRTAKKRRRKGFEPEQLRRDIEATFRAYGCVVREEKPE